MSSGGVAYIGSSARDGSVIVEEWTDSTTIRKRNRIMGLAGVQDDHNNPSIILEAGKVPLVFAAQHDAEQGVWLSRGTAVHSAGASLPTFEAPTLIPMSGNTTYSQVITYGNKLYLFSRTNAATRWSVAISTDWGATWAASQQLLSNAIQFYGPFRRRGDTIRFAASTHPVNGGSSDQNIYYGEIDIPTGNVSAGGSVLGNLDGTNLPIAITALELAAAPTSGYKTWVYDVGTTSNPEIVWCQFDNSNRAGTSTYRYSTKVNGSWVSNQIVAAGGVFERNVEPYFGGAQLVSAGKVVTARSTGSSWVVETKTTIDNGANWSTVTVATESRPERTVVRAWPVVQLDGVAPPFEIVANWTAGYHRYMAFRGNVGPTSLT